MKNLVSKEQEKAIEDFKTSLTELRETLADAGVFQIIHAGSSSYIHFILFSTDFAMCK